LHAEQRFSYEATAAYYPHAPPEAAAQAYCDRCVDDALAQLDSFGDGDVEEFLPQLANLFLGCAEPSGTSSLSSGSFNRADASQGSRPPWEAWQRAFAATWESLGQESEGSSSRSSSSSSGGGDHASRGGQSQWAPAIAQQQLSPPSPPLAEQQVWAGMRQRLESAVLRRCALNPSLAVKLAWLLDDVSGPPPSQGHCMFRRFSFSFEHSLSLSLFITSSLFFCDLRHRLLFIHS
jgi:hypothetical protein